MASNFLDSWECLETVLADPLEQGVLLLYMPFKGGPSHWVASAIVPLTLVDLRVQRDVMSVMQVDSDPSPLLGHCRGSRWLHQHFNTLLMCTYVNLFEL